MKFAHFEINGKGFIVGLVILLVSFVPGALLSVIGIINGGIVNILFWVSWIIVPIIMILAGLAASYIGKYSNLSNGVITSVVLFIVYFIIVFILQSLLMPAMSGGEITGIGSAMEVTIPADIYYSQIMYSFIRGVIFLIIGGVIGVFLFKRKLTAAPPKPNLV